MKYWCDSCETAVDDDDVKVVKDYQPVDGTFYHNPYGDSIYCPNCGEELGGEEAGLCAICGEWISPDKTICQECEDELTTYIEMMIDGYAFDKDVSKDEAKAHFEYWLEQKGEL